MEVKALELLGKTLSSIDVNDDKSEIVFTTLDGDRYLMCHLQDCVEYVRIDDICGDLDDLIGSPILMADEATNSDETFGREIWESFTWTFYKFSTIKGDVTIKWLGESNGCYSESVDFVKIEN